MPPEYGRIEGESEHTYRNSGCVGSSELGMFKRNEALWAGLRGGRWPRTDTSHALGFGRLFHAMILQPEIVDATYAVMPKADGRTKEGKALKEAFMASHTDREVVTQADWELCFEMRQALHENVVASCWTEGAHEVTYRTSLDGLGIQCRCDTENRDEHWISDLKSTDSLDKFRRTFRDYGYHRQSALYRLVVSKVLDIPLASVKFMFVAVEKHPPYAVGIYQMTDQLNLLGESEVDAALARMRAVKAGAKPRRDPEGVQMLDCPEYLLADLNFSPEPEEF